MPPKVKISQGVAPEPGLAQAIEGKVTENQGPHWDYTDHGILYTVFVNQLAPDDMVTIKNVYGRDVGIWDFQAMLLASDYSIGLDPDLAAALQFLYRRQNGEPLVTYRSIAATVTYDEDVKLGDRTRDEDDEDEVEEAGSPKDSGESSEP